MLAGACATTSGIGGCSFGYQSAGAARLPISAFVNCSDVPVSEYFVLSTGAAGAPAGAGGAGGAIAYAQSGCVIAARTAMAAAKGSAAATARAMNRRMVRRIYAKNSGEGRVASGTADSGKSDAGGQVNWGFWGISLK